jgi:hypothetical protein
MKRIIEFTSYGTYSNPVAICVDRITNFWHIEFNGRIGTDIQLDTGKTITVSESFNNVKNKLDNLEMD